MDYTWEAYQKLVELIKIHGYEFTDYIDFIKYKKVCIMRHDIDFDIAKAVKMSDFEKRIGITSIYFVLCDSPLYNILSNDSIRYLKQIIENGSEVGLHFDASTVNSYNELESKVLKHKSIIENIVLDGTKKKLRFMSYHIPNERLLNSDSDSISGLINVYSKQFFTDFKYISDSSHRWREDPIEIISNERFSKIQCLTHPIWYLDENKDIKYYYSMLISNENERKKYLIDNFKCFKDIEV